MKQIDVILFDMDGVLIDARELHYEALNVALARFGLMISRCDHLTNFDGLSTRQKLSKLSEDRILPVGLHLLINALKQKFTLEKIPEYTRPMFNHRYLLGRLVLDGYRLGVCSNSVRKTVNFMLESARIDSYFELTLSNEDVRLPKPNPDIYLEAAKRMKVQPERCLVIEDNPIGIKAATDAGMHFIKVSNPSEVTYDRVASALQVISRASAP